MMMYYAISTPKIHLQRVLPSTKYPLQVNWKVLTIKPIIFPESLSSSTLSVDSLLVRGERAVGIVTLLSHCPHLEELMLIGQYKSHKPVKDHKVQFFFPCVKGRLCGSERTHLRKTNNFCRQQVLPSNWQNPMPPPMQCKPLSAKRQKQKDLTTAS